ncbi:MAG: tetratricopeptide repeat protein [Nitrospirales bacterium]
MVKIWCLVLAGLVLVLTGCVNQKKVKSNVVDPMKAQCESEQKQVWAVAWDMTTDWACKTTGMCAHAERVKIIVPHPADINLTKYKTVAFTKIGGNYGDSFASAVKSQMIGKDNLTVMDRTQLDKILQELGMTQEDLFDADKRAKLGNLLPTAALVMGNVNGEYKQEKRTKRETCYTAKVPYPCTKEFSVGVANMIADVSFVEVETSATIQVKHLTATSGDDTDKIFDLTSMLNPTELQEKNLQEIVSDMTKAVVPYSTKEEVFFYADQNLPTMERGIVDAEAGDLEKAKEVFLKAISDNESNKEISQKTLARAYFNVGVIYLHTREFDKAEKAFETVDNLALKAFPAAQMRKLTKCYEDEHKKMGEQQVVVK